MASQAKGASSSDKKQKPSPLRSIIAGSTAGAIEIAITYFAELVCRLHNADYWQLGQGRYPYKLRGPMLQPKSQPTYFDDLVREIEEAPNCSWFGRLGKRLSGMIRL